MEIPDIIAKAKVLLEALPYIQDFHGSIFVVKYGGSFMDDPDPTVRISVATDIAFLAAVGINVVVVHGGGKAINRAMDEAGVKTTLISAGKFKVEGNPYTPLDEEAQAFMQSRVDDYYGAFTKAVARGRGVPVSQVRDGMGQGRVLGADAALTHQMVDGVATLDDLISKMRRAGKAQAKPSVSRLAQARNALALF